MKRFLGISVVAVGLLAVAATGYQKYRNKSFEAEREMDSLRIQRDYLERVGWIRNIPDEKSYKQEVTSFFRWYFNEIREHQNRFRTKKNFDEYLSEIGKKSDKEQVAEKKAHYEYVRSVFDAMRSGKYEPVFTATEKGMRLDVISASVKNVMGKPQIQLAIALWGAQRELRDESIGSGSVVVTNRRRMYTSAQFNVNWKLVGDQGTFLAEVKQDGDPSMKVDYPERVIAEFPPQMVLGYFPMDLIPSEIEQAKARAPVTKLEITFTVASRAPTGGDAVSNFVWKLDTPSEWKLRPGEKWVGAEESVRPLDEIDPKARSEKPQARN